MLIRSDPRQRDECQPYAFTYSTFVRSGKEARLLRNKYYSLMCQYKGTALQFWQRDTIKYIKLKPRH